MQMYLWPRVCEEEVRRVCEDVHSLREREREEDEDSAVWVRVSD